jgi:CBS-domain-containing membrane protein
MTHRTVREVMTAEVATVGEDTPFKELVGILAQRGVSALPVLTARGRVAGVVSEVDLLAGRERRTAAAMAAPGRPGAGRRPDRQGCDDLASGDRRAGRQYRRSGQGFRPSPRQAPRGDRRCDGRLIGIITRSDLLTVYLRPGNEIQAEIFREVITGYLGTNPDLVKVAVADGVVTLDGEVEKKSMIRLAVKMARSVDGVVDVVDKLSYAIDDTHVPPVPTLTES